MGGNSGGIIVQNHAKIALTDPIVHGQLPPHMCHKLDPILAKDPPWEEGECDTVATAYSWALLNLK